MTQLIEHLEVRLKQGRPGAAAHQEIMSYVRDAASEVRSKGGDFREGAVIMLLYPHRSEHYLSFILRPTYDGVHSGQVAFPGGKREHQDQDLLDTALRETEEEIGVDRSQLKVIGDLTEVYIPPSNFVVRPYIAIAEKKPVFIPDPREVAEVLEYPLSHFLREDAVRRESMVLPQFGRVKVGAFKPGDQVIWGATAMMVAELRALLI